MQVRGFTLLELLLVLLILGLMTALSLPRLLTLSERLQVAHQKDDVLSQINRLGFQAYRAGRSFTLTQYPSPALNSFLNLPADWSLTTQAPIQYRANGICEGGTIFLHYQQYNFPFQLQAPFCQAQQ